jgi:hypothetical protein
MYIYAIIDKLHEDTFFEKILLLKYEVGVLKIRRFGSAQRPDFPCPERSRVEGDKFLRKFLLPERSRRAQKFSILPLRKSGASAPLSDRIFLALSESGAEGRKNLVHYFRKSGASAPLSDRIFLALSGVEGLAFLTGFLAGWILEAGKVWKKNTQLKSIQKKLDEMQKTMNTPAAGK